MRIILFALTLMGIINSTISCQGQNSDNSQLKELKERITDRTYPRIDGIIVEYCDQIIVEEYFNKFDRNSRHDT